MTPDEYQSAALRTECDEQKAANRMVGYEGLVFGGDIILRNVRLTHATIGLTTEVGELATLLKKHVYYGQPLDTLKVKDEAGDILWYLALALSAVGISLSDTMEANIAKLKTRFPDKFTEELARDDARNRKAEHNALAGDSKL